MNYVYNVYNVQCVQRVQCTLYIIQCTRTKYTCTYWVDQWSMTIHVALLMLLYLFTCEHGVLHYVNEDRARDTIVINTNTVTEIINYLTINTRVKPRETSIGILFISKTMYEHLVLV